MQGEAETPHLIEAKSHLAYMLGIYTFIGKRVMLEENRHNAEFVRYETELLPAASAAVNSTSFCSAEQYESLESDLEKSWQTWRMQMPISRGMPLFAENILSTLGDKSSYDQTLYQSFLEALTPTQEMIDNIKNSTVATDVQGKTALNALQQLVDGLQSGYIPPKPTIEAKVAVMAHIEAYLYQAARDTQPQKSTATLHLLEKIHKAQEIVCNIRTDKEKCLEIMHEMQNCYENEFLPALCLGRPFQLIARKLYFEAAKDAQLYTTESFERVSAAMNRIDDTNATALDYERDAMFKELKDSIEALVRKPQKSAEVSLKQFRTSDELRIDVELCGGLDIVYGCFSLYYDDTLLSFCHASLPVKNGKNCVFFKLNKAECPLEAKTTIASISFEILKEVGSFPFCIEANKLYDKDNMTISYEQKQLPLSDESFNVVFETGMVTAKKYSLLVPPSIVPEKPAYVFDGLYVDGKKIIDKLFVCESCEAVPRFKPCGQGPLEKNKIAIGAYTAIHTDYAIEDDFRKIAENGTDFIILDYYHGQDKCKKVLRWAEKYGVRAYIHDFDLNQLEQATVNDVIDLTQDYINSPVFLGNDLYDEPNVETMRRLSQFTKTYKKALPDYDFHVNLYPIYFFGISDTFEEYIRSYLRTIHADHISTDVYPLICEDGIKSTKADYFEGIYVTAKAARDHRLSHWVYIQLLTGMDKRAPDMVDLRFQAYCCLAFGASKIVYYTYDVPGYNGEKRYSREVYAMRNYAHEYTELWDFAQTVNEELKRFSDKYESFEYKNSFVLKNGEIPPYAMHVPEFSDSVLEIQSDQTLLIGVFEKGDSGEKMFMLTNASEPSHRLSANVKLSADKQMSCYVRGIKAETTQFSLESGCGAMVIL